MSLQNIVSIRESDGNIVKLEAHDKLPSVAALAKQYAAEGYPDRYAIFAERQSKFKDKEEIGEDRGIFLSLILRPSFFPSQASLLGALCASSMLTALSEHTDKRLGIGWVSDIYCEGVKIGSATIEGKLDKFNAYEYLIITFSLRLNGKDFPPRLTDMVKKVFESENTSVAMIMARNILSKFFIFYPNLRSSSKFMEIYTESFILKGKRIRYRVQDKKYSCRVLGVDLSNGSLIIERKGGKEEKVTAPTRVTTPKKIKLKKNKTQT